MSLDQLCLWCCLLCYFLSPSCWLLLLKLDDICQLHMEECLWDNIYNYGFLKYKSSLCTLFYVGINTIILPLPISWWSSGAYFYLEGKVISKMQWIFCKHLLLPYFCMCYTVLFFFFGFVWPPLWSHSTEYTS